MEHSLFIDPYILLHLVCIIFITLCYVLQEQRPDFIDWLIIIFLAPVIVLFFILLLIFKKD